MIRKEMLEVAASLIPPAPAPPVDQPPIQPAASKAGGTPAVQPEAGGTDSRSGSSTPAVQPAVGEAGGTDSSSGSSTPAVQPAASETGGTDSSSGSSNPAEGQDFASGVGKRLVSHLQWQAWVSPLWKGVPSSPPPAPSRALAAAAANAAEWSMKAGRDLA